jgi:hypothetical protein
MNANSAMYIYVRQAFVGNVFMKIKTIKGVKFAKWSDVIGSAERLNVGGDSGRSSTDRAA